MKKSLIYIQFSLLLMFAFQSSANSLDSTNIAKKKLYIGFGFGIINSNIGEFYFPNKSNYPGLGYKNAITLELGLQVQYRFKKRLWFCSGIDFVSKGGGYERDNNNVITLGGQNNGTKGKYYYKVRLRYLGIPLLVKIPFSPSRQNSFYVTTGSGIEFLTEATFSSNSWVYGSGTGLVSATSVDKTISVYANPIDLPLHFSFGFQMKDISKANGFMELKTSFGTQTLFDYGDNKSFTIGIYTGFLF